MELDTLEANPGRQTAVTVEQPDVIDLMTIEDETGVVLLTISDHLPLGWRRPSPPAVQTKLNYYLTFCLDGQLAHGYPEHAHRPVVINLVHKFPPDATALRLLAPAEEAVAEDSVAPCFRTS